MKPALERIKGWVYKNKKAHSERLADMPSAASYRAKSRYKHPQQPGAILVLTAVLMVVLIGMVAFGVDLGYVVLTRTELQAAADAAALAGAGAAAEGKSAATQAVYRFASMHTAAGQSIRPEQVQIRYGLWDKNARVFVPSSTECSAVEVTIRSVDRPLFFGRLLGQQFFRSEAKAIATFAPRDIMLVLDYSASMCYDSQLRSIDELGRAAVEANLLQIYQALGSPRFGNMQWTPQLINSSNISTVKSALGLTNVPYPYPGGSWDDYINYVMTDSYINQAGYRRRYGYLTWVNYLQAKRYLYSHTPDLWKTPEQPITALKDAVDVLTAYLAEHSPDDRLGLAIYTASDGTALLESPMIQDFRSIAQIVRRRQAGHYHAQTNISAGMRVARLQLQNNARPGARRVMILMTDGEANLPTNETVGKQKVIEEAQAAAAARIPIITIALGAEADDNLMRQVAEITRGAYFKIPGGQPVSQYEEQLKEVFRLVAADRNLVLVQ
ncbi:MAG: VWA domain-containing protein [Thermoguttaceae bacterium]|nr:VWA domain-containing protein [Thermoguttaceae bacterium]MDW8036664.1 VWA domain-containing protein [Thermoguttaceae bacterium]